MPERRIEAVLPPELSAIWSRLAQDAETDEEVLRRLILMASPSSRFPLTRNPHGKPNIVLSFRLSASDALKARNMAEAAGFALSTWVRALVLARSQRSPQYSPDELRAHSVIRYELQRIGSTMRAAAQRLDAEHPQQARLLLDAYADARRQLLALRAAIAGSLLYWEIEDD